MYSLNQQFLATPSVVLIAALCEIHLVYGSPHTELMITRTIMIHSFITAVPEKLQKKTQFHELPFCLIDSAGKMWGHFLCWKPSQETPLWAAHQLVRAHHLYPSPVLMKRMQTSAYSAKYKMKASVKEVKFEPWLHLFQCKCLWLHFK